MVTDARTLHAELTDFLTAHHVPDAAFDVQCMMEQVTGSPFAVLLGEGLPTEQENPLRNMAQRRAFGEPLQYILGEWEFYGLRLYVGKGVLIPRADTETLVDTVLGWCREHPPGRILDLCTGSGCIPIALKAHLPEAEVSGIELSEQALGYAQKNTALHGLELSLICGDVLSPELAAQHEGLDVIVSNPPYLTAEEMAQLQPEVMHEPASALAGGEDGLDFYRELTRLWRTTLRPGGLLAYEIGWQQGEAVHHILSKNGFTNIQIIKDAEQRDRVVTGERYG